MKKILLVLLLLPISLQAQFVINPGSSSLPSNLSIGAGTGQSLALTDTNPCVKFIPSTAGDSSWWIYNNNNSSGTANDSLVWGNGTTCGTTPGGWFGNGPIRGTDNTYLFGIYSKADAYVSESDWLGITFDGKGTGIMDIRAEGRGSFANTGTLVLRGGFCCGAQVIIASTDDKHQLVFDHNELFGDIQAQRFSIVTPGTAVSGGSLGSSFRYYMGGVIDQQVNSVGNVGSGEDTLYTFSTGTGNLATNNQTFRLLTGGSFTASVNNKRIRVHTVEGANDTTILDTGALAITAAGNWKVECFITRTGATTLKSSCSINTDETALLSSAKYTTGTFTWANAGVIKITGEATSDNDIVAELWRLYYEPQP